MCVAVPVLVALTDRVPARRVYLVGTGLTALSHLGFALLADGFWSAPWPCAPSPGSAGPAAYMPGLKAIADRLEGEAQSRAVTWHAAGVGIAGAASFAVAGGLDALAGPAAAFLFGGVAALAAVAIARRGDAGGAAAPAGGRPAAGALLDFRPVFRNRAAMAWIVGYTVHTWELAALRAWARDLPRRHHRPASARPPGCPGRPCCSPSPGSPASRCRSPATRRRSATAGRGWWLAAMGAAAVLSLLAGWIGAVSAPLAALCVIAWNAAIYLDSSALTAGHGAGRGAGAARRDDGAAQHVRLCRRLPRAARRRAWRWIWRGPARSAGRSASATWPLVTLVGLAVLRRLGRQG